MELKGTIIAVLEPKSGVSEKGEWTRQEFVLEYENGQYPKRVVFDIFGQDKLQQANIQMGGTYTIQLDIAAREYNGRWYNQVRCWNVRPGIDQTPQQEAQPTPQPAFSAPMEQSMNIAPSTDTDDLPF